MKVEYAARLLRKFRSLQLRLGLDKARAITLSRPVLEGDTITVRVDPGAAVQFIRCGKLTVSYPTINLNEVPDSVKIVPAVGALLAVACALGVPIRLEQVDEDFAKSCDAIADVMRTWYPDFAREGFELQGDRIRSKPAACKGNLLLYSGGVDAITSLIRNLDSTSGLMTVWGADVPVHETGLWNSLNAQISSFEAAHSKPRYVVKTNLRDFVRGKHLVPKYIGGSQTWWMKAQHGTALVTLAAPLAFALGVESVMIASTHSEYFRVPWGSSPELDSLICVAGVTTKHDAFELTRQQKISEVIKPYCVDSESPPKLAVCYSPSRFGTSDLNCGKCEKCIRTIYGLIAAGLDPETMGLPLDQKALDQWQKALESNGWRMSINKCMIWKDIQSNAMKDISLRLSAYEPRLRWLKSFDFSLCLGENDG